MGMGESELADLEPELWSLKALAVKEGCLRWHSHEELQQQLRPRQRQHSNLPTL